MENNITQEVEMSSKNVLEQAERKVYRASFEDGLIDMGIAAFTLMFAVAPLLSVTLGDFWSSVVFLPFWLVVYLLLRWVKKRFVTPRTGTVIFGAERVAKLRRGGWVMLGLNVAFLLVGVFTFFFPGDLGFMIALRFSAIMLLFFSMAGYFYDLNQLYVYGVLCALAIPVGEWLWQRELVSHHGFPMVFGTITGIIFLWGLVKFIRLMQMDIPSFEEQSA
jgi:hypothetical protein